MAYITNGYKRSLVITINRLVDGVVDSDYPHVYDGQGQFVYNGTTYPALTDDEVAKLTTFQFQTRLNIVKQWVKSQELGITGNESFWNGSSSYDTSVCPDEVVVETTTTTTTTSTSSTTSTTCTNCTTFTTTSTTTTTTTSTSTTSTSTTTKATVLWAVNGSRIIKSTNFGQTWNTVYIASSTLRSITFIDENTGFATGVGTTGKQGLIYKTTDGGNLWYDVYNQLPASVDGRSIFSSTQELSDKVFFGGNMSTFVVYNKATDSFSDITRGTSHNSYDMYAFNANEVISVTSLSASVDYMLRTTNGGSLWYEPATAPQDRTITGMDFNGNDGVLVSASSGTLYKVWTSSDKGVTWVTNSPLTIGSHAMQDVSFPLPTRCYAVGCNQVATEGKLWLSIDKGLSWADYTSKLPANTKALRCVNFFDDAIGWIGGDYGKVYYTTDYGNTWQSFTAPDTTNQVADIYIMQI